jgi:hypothetical protein
MLLASGLRLDGASDFWNKKASEDWSASEVDQLKNKSPWARKVRAEVGGGRAGAMNRGGSPGTFGGMTGADANGLSAGNGRSRTSSADLANAGAGAGGGTSQGPEVVVRWETAKPVMEATKIQLPAAFDNHYAVSVTGLPPQLIMAALRGGRGDAEAEAEDPAARQKAAIEHMLAATTLTVKGGKPLPSDLLVQSQDKASLIFAFAKEGFPVAATDREVSFDMDFGVVKVRAKFDPKEMTYKGELAV